MLAKRSAWNKFYSHLTVTLQCQIHRLIMFLQVPKCGLEGLWVKIRDVKKNCFISSKGGKASSKNLDGSSMHWPAQKISSGRLSAINGKRKWAIHSLCSESCSEHPIKNCEMGIKSRKQRVAISGSVKHKLSGEKGYAKYIADILERRARNKILGVGSSRASNNKHASTVEK